MGVIDKVRPLTAERDALLPLDQIVIGDCIAAMQSPITI